MVCIMASVLNNGLMDKCTTANGKTTNFMDKVYLLKQMVNCMKVTLSMISAMDKVNWSIQMVRNTKVAGLMT